MKSSQFRLYIRILAKIWWKGVPKCKDAWWSREGYFASWGPLRTRFLLGCFIFTMHAIRAVLSVISKFWLAGGEKERWANASKYVQFKLRSYWICRYHFAGAFEKVNPLEKVNPSIIMQNNFIQWVLFLHILAHWHRFVNDYFRISFVCVCRYLGPFLSFNW